MAHIQNLQYDESTSLSRHDLILQDKLLKAAMFKRHPKCLSQKLRLQVVAEQDVQRVGT